MVNGGVLVPKPTSQIKAYGQGLKFPGGLEPPAHSNLPKINNTPTDHS